MRFDLLQFCCSPIFCRKKSSLLWRVPLRLLCLRQETAHPVDGFPLFIVQHMRIFLSGDNGGMAHEVLDDADGNILFHQPCGEGMPIQYNKDKSENPCKIKGFRDLSLFFFRLFFIKIRLCKVGRKGQCYINDKITATGNGGMNGKQKLDCLQRNHRCL